ncbi:restriction endonuclease subunit S [Flagellimonas sp.]|uniref:restriction endonuclease subunit S n=1 Tax=Flagellimonas sp. TaxID=2058762 RepID=UPI003BA99138
MKKRLGDIAEIRFGPYLKAQDSGQCKYLKASHFNKQAKLTKFEHSFVDFDGKSERELLRSNDLILAGKGQRNFAWAYEEDKGPCVASSLFFVITPYDKNLDSAYLALYLNSERLQHKLRLISGGLTIPSISKKELENLVIDVPGIQEQKKFVHMAELLNDDVELTEKLLVKKRAMRKTILNKMIRNLKKKS